jgi:hypothetical protein
MSLKRSGEPANLHLEARCIDRDSESQFFRFALADGEEQSFAINHLVKLRWMTQGSGLPNGNAPEQLVLSFSTHDVKLEGWRLKSLRKLIGRGEAVAVMARDVRYAHLSANEPFVSAITIERARTED